MSIDLEQFSLRRFLRTLGEDHLQHHAGPTDLCDIANLLEGSVPAHFFALPGGSRPELVGNVMASRERMARAFDTTPGQLVTEVLKRVRKPQPIVTVQRSEAPVQQVVLMGDEADLTKLPVHLQHEFDGAPYIGAIDYTRDPSTGWTNVGVRRLMLRGRRTAGVDLVAPSDLRALYLGHAKRKEPMPIAFVIGAHPVDYVTATMRMPVDELELLSSLRGAPLGVVKCLTNDLLVPADAEYVLEGYLDPHGHVEPEGPYGEFLGYYGGVKRNPLFRLTAITHRRDPLFQTLSISGRTMDRTDTAQLCSLRTEVAAWQAIQLAVRELKAVYASAGSGGMFNLRVAMQQRVPGEARNAIAAAFSTQANIKHVFVVDPDIDIFSDSEMDWALATRFQANRDLVTMEGMRAMPLDPSLHGQRTGSKLGFDLTLPLLAPGEQRSMEHQIPTPPQPATVGAAGVSPADALAEGPKTFAELMRAVGSRDGRELVCWLETQDQAGRLDRDEAGRWRLKQAHSNKETT